MDGARHLIRLLNLLSIIMVVQANPQPMLTCGNSENEYNPLIEKCCSNRIFPLGGRSHPGCCGKEIYDKKSHICCKGTLAEVDNMSLPKCCGNLPYDRAANDCCGSELFNPVNQMCTDGVVGDIDNADQSYDMSSESCGSKNTFNPAQQICCSRKVTDIPAGTFHPGCCGADLMDKGVQRCCKNTLYYLTDIDNPGCCVDQVYDRSRHICCEGELLAIGQMGQPKCCAAAAYDVLQEECVDGVVKSSEIPITFTCTLNTIYGPRSENEMCGTHSLINTIEYPGLFMTTNVKCCSPDPVIAIPFQESDIQYQLDGVTASFTCPENQFVFAFCRTDQRRCGGNDWSMSCRTFFWNALGTTVEPDACREVSGWIEQGDVGGRWRSGEVACADNEFMTAVCSSKEGTGCHGGKGFSATCCTIKGP